MGSAERCAPAQHHRTQYMMSPRKGLHSRTLARITRLHPLHNHISLSAEGGLMKVQFYLNSQVTAPCRACSAPSPATAEHVSPKEGLENISKIGKSPTAAERTAGPTAPEAVVAIGIVNVALLRITQYLVRLGGFFEFLFSIRVMVIHIRMKTMRQRPIGFLDLLLIRAFVDAEDLVIVPLHSYLASRNRPSNRDVALTVPIAFS